MFEPPVLYPSGITNCDTPTENQLISLRIRQSEHKIFRKFTQISTDSLFQRPVLDSIDSRQIHVEHNLLPTNDKYLLLYMGTSITQINSITLFRHIFSNLN